MREAQMGMRIEQTHKIFRRPVWRVVLGAIRRPVLAAMLLLAARGASRGAVWIDALGANEI